MIDFNLLAEHREAILAGVWMTVKMSAGGISLGLLLGLALHGLRQLGGPWLVPLYHAYVALFRGTPLLVQLFLVFYGGPYIGLEWSAERVGLVGLALYGAAYFAEIFRAGREAIPRGQIESARDLGLSPGQTFRVVLWPQMLARCLAPLVGQTVILVKESSVLSIITVAELTNVAMTIATQSYSMLEPYAVLALAYWAIAIVVAATGARLERHFTQYQCR
ncbi:MULTISPECIES: amino acid ABC transporter permease [Pseudomonadaceae]|uniref:amino acid ABC transporter permease n=1 Tax=Pseudomonadaceae TaxID=135621 RepID=UPI00106D50CE|nr:amino acid ABC transporter permease [Pseudomonas aeruginosa]MPS55801.1 amino acid ABC transporter permease [Pseudomonas sp.]TVT63003.1 MAG: amino acid ABC transporter permease [Pseudomonas sp.]